MVAYIICSACLFVFPLSFVSFSRSVICSGIVDMNKRKSNYIECPRYVCIIVLHAVMQRSRRKSRRAAGKFTFRRSGVLHYIVFRFYGQKVRQIADKHAHAIPQTAAKQWHIIQVLVNNGNFGALENARFSLYLFSIRRVCCNLGGFIVPLLNCPCSTRRTELFCIIRRNL